MKFNIVKAASITGTVLSVACTLITGWAGKKATEEAIAKQVAKALAEQAKNN